MSAGTDVRLAARLHPRASLMSEDSAEVGVLLDVFVPGAQSPPKPVKLVDLLGALMDEAEEGQVRNVLHH